MKHLFNTIFKTIGYVSLLIALFLLFFSNQINLFAWKIFLSVISIVVFSVELGSKINAKENYMSDLLFLYFSLIVFALSFV